MASRESVVEACAFLGAAFGDKFPTPTVTDLRVWHSILEDVDDSALEGAVRDICGSDREWPPTPGQVRQAARSGGRRYADRAHRPFGELEGSSASPETMRRCLDEIAAGLDRPNLRVIEGEAS